MLIKKERLSAYEMKNNCCLFEGLFKIKKNGILLFGISFFILEILIFLYYVNQESNDIMRFATKIVKY